MSVCASAGTSEQLWAAVNPRRESAAAIAPQGFDRRPQRELIKPWSFKSRTGPAGSQRTLRTCKTSLLQGSGDQTSGKQIRSIDFSKQRIYMMGRFDYL